MPVRVVVLCVMCLPEAGITLCGAGLQRPGTMTFIVPLFNLLACLAGLQFWPQVAKTVKAASDATAPLAGARGPEV